MRSAEEVGQLGANWSRWIREHRRVYTWIESSCPCTLIWYDSNCQHFTSKRDILSTESLDKESLDLEPRGKPSSYDAYSRPGTCAGGSGRPELLLKCRAGSRTGSVVSCSIKARSVQASTTLSQLLCRLAGVTLSPYWSGLILQHPADIQGWPVNLLVTRFERRINSELTFCEIFELC